MQTLLTFFLAAYPLAADMENPEAAEAPKRVRSLVAHGGSESTPEEPPLVWCRTGGGADDGLQLELGAAGQCPIEGACDLASVRNQYLPDGETPFRSIKIHLLVFREDDGSNPAATAEEVELQLALMNADYAPHRIRFVHTWQFVDDSESRDLFSSFDVGFMKSFNGTDHTRQCNIFVTGFAGGLGVFPWSSSALTRYGGVVIGEDFFGPDQHVLTHEMAHNLGLWHVFRGVSEVTACSACYERADGLDADAVGDYCSDTPPGPGLHGQCSSPGTLDSCSGVAWGDIMPENYMSAGSDDGTACWQFFTPQQAARMHCWIEARLAGWTREPGDINGDGSVNDQDYGVFADCFTGPNPVSAPPQGCSQTTFAHTDIDGDGDVDLGDFALFSIGRAPSGE